jgi:trehalose-6-phosphate synthase
MNLVSYEYVACQNSKNTEGVLVLSEVSLRLNVLSFPLSADGPKNMLPVF